MADRISTSWSYNQSLGDMLNLQVQINETSAKISSGKELLTASDDPVAYARVLQLDQEINQMEQYEDNITLLDSRLELEDGVLSSVNNVLGSIRELTVQAGNEGVYTDTDLQSMADEMQQYLEEIVALANSTDGTGDYLFAGYQSEEPAFVESPGGGYSYEGDEGVRYMQISSSITLASSDSGKDVFLDIDSVSNSFYTSGSSSNTGSGIVSQGITVDQEALDAYFPEDIVIEFQNELDVDPPQTNYTVYRQSDGRVIDGLENVEYVEGQDISVAGMTVEITGDPDAGDEFYIETSSSQSMFVTIEKLIYALENYGSDSEYTELYSAAIEDALSNLDNAIDNVSSVRANIGTRLNATEDMSDQLADNILSAQEIRSDLEDLDYAAAVSQLTYEEFVLEAVQQTYTSINQLSLFDYL
ncbi:flagellar hook-associated protein FlgL [Reinekea marinisedimentorum]|uniref:Flagellar hook-associated protein 3 FlgL n=1 Tax=Reinekea marinisedimentorum TaxID=230495 RepID=A0A4R3I4S6_9GAMM|nr:flagellar hook-associated protein FlgL [Reinekea marinisedimentorum]TCS39911.1 flagellar hook-associated protein 3 FlgL [Reinekea marinisedimentorum]